MSITITATTTTATSAATTAATRPLDFDSCYRALTARDARFDGRFYTAVTTTGIYCRPICPARTPGRRNVRFYRHAAAAEAAGFRPCRRCRPELSPGDPGWDTRADLVARALRLIDDGVVDEYGVAGLASRLHVTDRHLHRLFTAELGAGPLSVARTRRLLLAKQLLTETALPIGDVAFAAGFGSLRQFNATMKEAYGFAPTELRGTRAGGRVTGARRAVPGDSAARQGAAKPRPLGGPNPDPGTESGAGPGVGLGVGSGVGPGADPGVRPGLSPGVGPVHGVGVEPVRFTLRLHYRPPYDAEALLGFLTARAIPGLEKADISGYSRVVPGGTITLAPARDHIALHVATADARLLARLVSRCRRLLDLDAEPDAIASVLRTTSLAPLVERRPGLRVPGAFDGFELAVRAVVGQQVSVAGARTLLGRIVARAGEPSGDGYLFPTAERLAQADLDGLGLTGRRIRTLRALARMAADGEVDLDGAQDPAEVAARLLAVPGIGPWTTGYIALRALRDPDAWPSGDLGLRRAMRRLAIPDDDIERWRPWRAYAALHLWSAS